MTTTPLTPKEKNVLEFIESFISNEEVSPTYQEIKDHFGFASFNSVQRYLKQLSSKGYIKVPKGNQKRALQVLQSSKAHVQDLGATQQDAIQKRGLEKPTRANVLQMRTPVNSDLIYLPLLGRVAAGEPIEVSGGRLKDLRGSGALTIHPAAYRVVYQH